MALYEAPVASNEVGLLLRTTNGKTKKTTRRNCFSMPVGLLVGISIGISMSGGIFQFSTPCLSTAIPNTPSTVELKWPRTDIDADTNKGEDCHGLAGMRVLLLRVHMEGNLGDELETTPLLQELKRCQVVTIALLSHWITHPQRLNSRSVRAHSLMDSIISTPTVKDFISINELPSSLTYDATIFAPGPGKFSYKGRKDGIPIDIHFGDSILKQCEFPKDLTLAVVREPESIRCIEKSNTITSNSSEVNGITTQPDYYMMGDLANIYEPAWSAVNFWRAFYAVQYKNVSSIIYSRDTNFDHIVHFEQNYTMVTLKPLRQSSPLIKLKSNEVLFLSNSPVEDHNLIALQEGKKAIPGLRQDQFLLLETIEQMFALTQHVQNIYTDRYHPGVIGYRFGKNVQLLDLSSRKEQNNKLKGLDQLMHDYPDPKVIQHERIPIAFQKLRDTLRMLRAKRNVDNTVRV